MPLAAAFGYIVEVYGIRKGSTPFGDEITY